MPRGVYERSEEQKARIASLARVGAAASVEYWRGRKRSPEQVAAHSARMRGRPAPNKGVAMSAQQRAKQTKHGHSVAPERTATYRSWQSMRQRCNDPGKDNYTYYGGRGIRVCERWDDFSAFLADMGERPAGTQLGRIDNDRDYEPGNAAWITKADNIAERNRRHGRKGATSRQLTKGLS